MNDLVQLMTRTLKMDNKENCTQPALPASELQFRLNRKYKDTLILHGKALEDPDEFQFQEFPSGLSYFKIVAFKQSAAVSLKCKSINEAL